MTHERPAPSRALVSICRRVAEVAHNGALLGASDGAIGPSAAPWGLPLLLWAVGAAFGWSLITLKLVGAVSLALLGMTALLLARIYLPRELSILAAITVTLNPVIFEQVNIVGSDLPFFALATLALVLIERSARLYRRRLGRLG